MHILNRVKFVTPESVELEFTLAGIGNRTFALLIDYHVLALIIALVLTAWLTISYQIQTFAKQIFGDKFDNWMVAIVALILFAVYAGYFVFFETFWQGQTPGKRVAKIRVVRDDGRPVGLQQTTLRALLRPFDEISFIGALLIMFNRKEKRLGDFVAGTIVIQTQTIAISEKQNLTLSESSNLACSKILETADLSPMLPDDFAVIREYLVRRHIMSKKAQATLANELTQQVQSIIELNNLPDGTTPDTFLEGIYLAYQQTS
ncbi:RDD domain-containing protein [Calothrix sp. NIES-4071]|nr:RDD domain-containing protein [Calothrix sp. NIES-4071]BAZ63956.1 RDD domain-containing protein [Calothrix sp. NIES-4105]